MVSDYKLFYTWQTEFPEVNMSEASEILAGRWKLSYDSVRGRLSRTNTIANRVKVGAELSALKESNPSVMRQNEVILESQKHWATLQRQWADMERPAVGYFISDVHRGAPFRNDYWELCLRILDREKHVDVFSAFNDWLNNDGWGRHEDQRTPEEKLVSADIQNLFNVEDYDYQTIRDLTGAIGVGINGNHDLWWYKYIRTHSAQSAELQIASRMEDHYTENKILMFNRMTHQNYVRLSEGLVWEHGTTTAKRLSGRARNALPKHTSATGQASSVVIGHTHRPGMVKGEEVDVRGVWFANAGTFYDYRKVDYSADGTGNGWNGGIVRCEFKPGSVHHNISLIEFRDIEGYAVAIRDGTKIDKVVLA